MEHKISKEDRYAICRHIEEGAIVWVVHVKFLDSEFTECPECDFALFLDHKCVSTWKQGKTDRYAEWFNGDTDAYGKTEDLRGYLEKLLREPNDNCVAVTDANSFDRYLNKNNIKPIE